MIKIENNEVEYSGKYIDIVFEISAVICEIVSDIAGEAQKSENEVTEGVLKTINSAVCYAIKNANKNDKENRP